MTRKTKMHELRDYIIIGLAMIEGSIGLGDIGAMSGKENKRDIY